MGRGVAGVDSSRSPTVVADAIGLVGCVLVTFSAFMPVLSVTDPLGTSASEAVASLSCSTLVHCDAGVPSFWRSPSAVGWIALVGVGTLAMLMAVRGLLLRSAAAVRLLAWVELLLTLPLVLSIVVILGSEVLRGRRTVGYQEWNHVTVVRPQWTALLVAVGLGALIVSACTRINMLY